MHGYGKKSWPTGRMYEGQWRKDLMEGRGRIQWPSGEYYEGHFRKGAFHGAGTRKWSSGEKYSGQFDNGELEGSGTFEHKKDGWTFQGQWMHGRMYGRGRMEWASGVVYVGEWQDGNRDGHGCLTWPDGSCFEGDFRCNNIDGKGCKTFAGGTRYEGQFVSGHLQGHGTLCWPDGREFEGLWHNSGIASSVEWHQSVLARPGRLRLLDGTVIESSNFGESGASGEGKKLWTCGCAYMGMLLKNHIHDSGAFSWPDGRRYSGRFNDGAMDGHGTLVWNDGYGICTYKGEFKQNNFAGCGSLEWSSGAKFEGEFQNGLYHGEGCFEWPGRRSFYRGQWDCGEICGKGLFECNMANSAAIGGAGGGGASYIYSGAFRRGHMDGKGQVTFALPTGGHDEYIGEFRFSNFTGLGAFNWNSGASLEGLFEDGYCNRVGRKVYPDGRVYSGALRFDLENGKGVVSEPGGRSFVAVWKSGRPVRELPESCAAELHFEGDLFLDINRGSSASILTNDKQGVPETLPALTGSEREKDALSESQSITSMSWNSRRQQRCSKGSMRPTLPIMDAVGQPLEGKAAVGFLNGDRYVGYFRGGQKHGRGVYVYADLTAYYRGIWEDDVLNGVRHPVMSDDLPVEVRKLHTYDNVPELEFLAPSPAASANSLGIQEKEPPTNLDLPRRDSLRRPTPRLPRVMNQVGQHSPDDSDSSSGESNSSSSLTDSSNSNNSSLSSSEKPVTHSDDLLTNVGSGMDDGRCSQQEGSIFQTGIDEEKWRRPS